MQTMLSSTFQVIPYKYAEGETLVGAYLSCRQLAGQ